MEEAVYYGAIAAMIAFGLHAGRWWARSAVQAVLLGLAGTAAAILVFLCLVVAPAVFAPDRVDSREMSVRLGALLVFGNAVGIVAALGGRRQAQKANRLF